MGGLGNQLFQLNFANYLYNRFPNIHIYLNTSFFQKDSRHGGYLLEITQFTIDNKKYKDFLEITDETFSEKIDSSKNIIFNGYWQDLKFFNLEEYRFTNFFNFNINKKNKTTAELIESKKNSVSIHVRCGDYNNHFLLGNVATKSYFNNAINKIYQEIDSPVFFIFSDSISWTKENLIFNPNSEVIYVDNKNSFSLAKWDIYLMSLCHYHINSNSSFSWWAQQFNNKQNKKVYFPEYWINDVCPGFKESKASVQNIKAAFFAPNIPIIKNELENPKYTIAISCYNQPMQIRRAISSVLNQTFEDFECIVIDDASTDTSISIISDYCLLNSKLKLIRHKKNSSRTVVRLTAAKEAKGKYLIFLDGDDYFMPNALEKLDIELCTHPDAEVLEFSYIMRPNNKIFSPPIYVPTESRFENYIKNKDLVPTIWNKIYKTDFLQSVFSKISPIYLNMAEDVYLSSCIAYKTKYYYTSNIIAINYVFGTGISTKKNYFKDNENYVKSIKIVTEQLYTFFSNFGENAKYYTDIIFSKLIRNYYYTVFHNTYAPHKTISLLLIGKYFDLEKKASFIPKLYEYEDLGLKAMLKKYIKNSCNFFLKTARKYVLLLSSGAK